MVVGGSLHVTTAAHMDTAVHSDVVEKLGQSRFLQASVLQRRLGEEETCDVFLTLQYVADPDFDLQRSAGGACRGSSQAQFLIFVTASDRVPLKGWQSLGKVLGPSPRCMSLEGPKV